MTFQFWRRWLIAVTIGVILYGLILMLFPMQGLFGKLFGMETSTFNAAATDYIRLMQGVLGAVIIGWMITLLLLILDFQPGQAHPWKTLTASVVIWFVLDTGFSLYIGVWAHALFNLGFLILFAIPLGAIARQRVQDFS